MPAIKHDCRSAGKHFLYAHRRPTSVGPRCRRGLRGLPRPECMSSDKFGWRTSTKVAQVRLSAKILSGREDLHVSQHASMFLPYADLSSGRCCPRAMNEAANILEKSSDRFRTHCSALADDMHPRRSETDRPTSQPACQHACRFFLRKSPEPEMFGDNKLRNVISDLQCKHTAVGHSRSTGQ